MLALQFSWWALCGIRSTYFFQTFCSFCMGYGKGKYVVSEQEIVVPTAFRFQEHTPFLNFLTTMATSSKQSTSRMAKKFKEEVFRHPPGNLRLWPTTMSWRFIYTTKKAGRRKQSNSFRSVNSKALYGELKITQSFVLCGSRQSRLLEWSQRRWIIRIFISWIWSRAQIFYIVWNDFCTRWVWIP